MKKVWCNISSLKDYIDDNYDGNNSAFGRDNNAQRALVRPWISAGYFVLDDKMCAIRRDLVIPKRNIDIVHIDDAVLAKALDELEHAIDYVESIAGGAALTEVLFNAVKRNKENRAGKCASKYKVI